MFIEKEKPNIDTVTAYMRHMKAAELSDNTIQSREQTAYSLNAHLQEEYGLDLSSENIGKVKGYMLDTWYQTLTASAQSKNLYVANIKGLFSYIVQAGYAERDASEVLKRVRVIRNDSEDDDNDRLAYSIDDAVALINIKLGPAVDARDRAIVAMLLGGGFRASELCSLNVGDFRNMRNGRIYTMRKGGAKKWVYVADYAIEYVEAYLAQRPNAKDDEPLFLSGYGNRFSRATLWQRMKRRQEMLELETGVHIMRHTFITEVSRRNPLSVAQNLGSHSDAQTTQIYINPTKDELRGAANSVSWGYRLNGPEDYDIG